MPRLFLALAAATALAGPAAAQTISLGNTGSGTTTSAASTVSWSQTVGAGASQALVVATAGRANGTGLGAVIVTGVTFTPSGGSAVSLTQVANATGLGNGSGGNALGSDVWYLFSPTQATGNITVTYAGSVTASGASAVLNNVRQLASSVAGYGSGGNNATTLSTVVPTTQANSWIVDFAASSQGTGHTLSPGGSGHVKTFDLNSTALTGAFGRGENLAAGTQTYNWTMSPADAGLMVHSAATFAPVPEPAVLLAVAAVGLAGWRRWRGAAG